MAGKYWREAATLLLVVRNGHGIVRSPFDYRVLMLKRSSKSKFMPNAYVFPGGVVDQTDFDQDWLKIFEKFGRQEPLPTLPLKNAHQPMIYKQDPHRALAFRINAIRETFEETGMFLGSKRIKDRDLRHRVHEDPGNFIKMCWDLKASPDIWSLHDWSDWLTPNHLKGQGKGRFDTMFYIAFASEAGAVTEDSKEVTEVQFVSPKEAFDRYESKDIWLAPPQIYELARMANFEQYDAFKQFSSTRTIKGGVETWLPVFAKCSDGQLSLYPGDELYPDDPDYEGIAREGPLDFSDKKMSDMKAEASRRNRMEVPGLHGSRLDCTIEDPNGHKPPKQLF